nr:hypothetical protein [Butyrivibrio sp.]
KLQIHEYRFNKLKNWAEGKDEEDLNDKAFDYYKTEFGKEEEVSKGMENKIEELASEAIATREELKKFELSRITDIQKKNREVIRQLMDYIDASGITDMNTPNQNLTNYYYEIAKKDIDYSLSDYASADDLIQYERDRLAEDNEDRNRRFFALINKMVELNITEDKRDQPDKEFLDFYKNYNDYEGYDDSTRWQRIKGSTKVKFKEKKNKYIGKSLFRSPLEFGLADIDTIIAYEESELVRDEDASKAYIAFREIEAYKTKYEKETDDNEKEILLNRAKAVLFDGRTISDVRKESYRWATGQELLDYEQQKVATNKNDQLNKRTTIKDLLKGVDYTGLKEYFISNEKRKEIIKENVSIPTIIIYENGRKHYYEGKNKKDKAKKHEDRAKYLSQEYDKANEINDPEMKKLHIDRIRADYFSGKADFISRENVQNASAVSGFLDGAVKGNYIADDEAIIEALKTEIGKQKHVKNFLISDNHYELEQKLLKLQEEKESDVHMVEIYKDARGSQFKHFQEDYARKNRNLKKSEITMEQMYRFAESKARETSTHSWYVKTRKKAAELAKWGINKGAGAAAGKELDLIELKDEKDKTIMSTGGHLERIQRLRELKNSDEFKELSNEEKIKKLQDLYENHLGGGRGLTNYVNEHADALVTPNMILEYEDRRLKEESQKRIDRIELLKSGKKEEYRALAKRDGSGFKDTIKKISSVVNPFFKLGADKALKDKNILKPIDLINFQYKEMDRLTKKYSERFAFLSDKSLTDKDAWEGYRDKFGGGKAFLKFNAGKLEGKKNLIKSTQFGSGSFSYQNLSGFEEAQADIYRQRLKRANMQFTRSANEKKVIEAKIKKIKESIARLREAK